MTPVEDSYSIGLLVRCNDPWQCFPTRFLHVLLLRLIFKFTLSAASIELSPNTPPKGSSFQRRCTMWKTGVHWLMEEGVECLVELINSNKAVVVITKSKNEWKEDCVCVFHAIMRCVLGAKAEFCHTIKPNFFLLGCTTEQDYLEEDNFFAMSEVERAFTYPKGKNVILSVTGKMQMECSRFHFLCQQLTHWHSLFPIDFISVLNLLGTI